MNDLRERYFSIEQAFFLKAVYDLPTTKVLIENLETNPSLRRLCGWEYRSQVPSESTFSRAFTAFSEQKLLDIIHGAVVTENYEDKIVGHSSMDSTAIVGREKSCSKNTPKKESKAKKKRGRKSKAELAAMEENEVAEIKTRRLELQPNRTLAENLADLPLAGILTSASPHDSQVAIPLMQTAYERAKKRVINR